MLLPLGLLCSFFHFFDDFQHGNLIPFSRRLWLSQFLDICIDFVSLHWNVSPFLLWRRKKCLTYPKGRQQEKNITCQFHRRCCHEKILFLCHSSVVRIVVPLQLTYSSVNTTQTNKVLLKKKQKKGLQECFCRSSCFKNRVLKSYANPDVSWWWMTWWEHPNAAPML